MSLMRDLCGPLSFPTRPQTQAESANLHNRDIFNVTPQLKGSPGGGGGWGSGVSLSHISSLSVFQRLI